MFEVYPIVPLSGTSPQRGDPVVLRAPALRDYRRRVPGRDLETVAGGIEDRRRAGLGAPGEV
jgi:hypothetical protein